MPVRLYFNSERFTKTLQAQAVGKTAQVRQATRAAAADMAADFVRKASADVAGAGNFGSRWTEGFTTTITEGGGHIRVAVAHKVPYFSVFQYGKVIQGKPLLWLPFSFAQDAQGVWPRDFPRPLFRVDRKSDGLPILFAFTPSGKKRGWPTTASMLGLRKSSPRQPPTHWRGWPSTARLLGLGKAEPKYFAKKSVTIPQKFQTDAIALEAVDEFNEFFAMRMKQGA